MRTYEVKRPKDGAEVPILISVGTFSFSLAADKTSAKNVPEVIAVRLKSQFGFILKPEKE